MMEVEGKGFCIDDIFLLWLKIPFIFFLLIDILIAREV
jgi:hypothetical protein